MDSIYDDRLGRREQNTANQRGINDRAELIQYPDDSVLWVTVYAVFVITHLIFLMKIGRPKYYINGLYPHYFVYFSRSSYFRNEIEPH